MDQQQSRWRPTRRHLLWTVGINVALVGAYIFLRFAYVREWKWTGLVKNANYHNRTLWDWMKLLIIPAVLAGGGIWFNRQQREREQDIAEQRAQDEALQAYLDEMSQLLTDKDRPLRQAKEDDEVRTLARARTLTVLARLDGSRKWSVLMFLKEAGLISIKDGPVVSLKWANLQDADLGEVVLEDADLRETKLQRAYLYAAKLRGASLVKVNLSGADLAKADLSGADLSDARGLTEVQLTKAESLEDATMPNGQKYEDWLESKGRGEDGENSAPS